MQISKGLRRSIQTVFTVAQAALSGQTATAQASYHHQVARAKHPAAAPKTTSKSKGGKASSFAPHATKRRVYGAPIQPPIVHPAPPPK